MESRYPCSDYLPNRTHNNCCPRIPPYLMSIQTTQSFLRQFEFPIVHGKREPSRKQYHTNRAYQDEGIGCCEDQLGCDRHHFSCLLEVLTRASPLLFLLKRLSTERTRNLHVSRIKGVERPIYSHTPFSIQPCLHRVLTDPDPGNPPDMAILGVLNAISLFKLGTSGEGSNQCKNQYQSVHV